MLKIILIIFIFLNLHSKELFLTKNDVKTIKASKDKYKIVKRFTLYNNLKDKIKDYQTFKKLSHINSFYNKILSSLDINEYKMEDYWATRKEFIIQGKGDCEDYVIAKYFSLIESNIKKEQLYLAVAQVKGSITEHMVLLYFETKDSIPLVLDNLSFKVVPLNIRKKLTLKFAFNEIDSYTLKDNHLDKKVNVNWGEEDKWNNLLTRIYTKNE